MPSTEVRAGMDTLSQPGRGTAGTQVQGRTVYFPPIRR